MSIRQADRNRQVAREAPRIAGYGARSPQAVRMARRGRRPWIVGLLLTLATLAAVVGTCIARSSSERAALPSRTATPPAQTPSVVVAVPASASLTPTAEPAESGPPAAGSEATPSSTVAVLLPAAVPAPVTPEPEPTTPEPEPELATAEPEPEPAMAEPESELTTPEPELAVPESEPATPPIPALPPTPAEAATAPEAAPPTQAPRSPTGSEEEASVERALRALTTDEARVGQLFLLGWAGNQAEQARQTLRELRPGGIVFVGNTSSRSQAAAINAALAAMAAQYDLAPLLIAVDHEGGPVQRIVDVANVGSNGAFARRRPSEREACERGQTHARQLRSMGFTMNLAPVLDVNTNPNNPVIGVRSYGADPWLVASLGSAYVRGLQGGGVAAVGKHFPGHGNTSVDSHLQLPILPQTEAQLDRTELVPFRAAVAPSTDLAAIMSAHIVFPAVDPTRVPATLSRAVMTGLLRDKLGFEGLAVSDDLGAMRAITDHYAPGVAAVRAIRAGVDLLIIGGDLARQRASRNAVLAALATGELGHERVDEAVRRVLRTKARFGLLGGTSPPVIGCA